MKTSKQIRSTAKQLMKLCLVDGKLDEGRVRQVIQGILDGKRRGYLKVLARFQHLAKDAVARRTAQVESAVPLPDDLQTSVRAGLAKVYGAGLNVDFREQPALIGGIRIRVGSDVYDGSVQGALTALERKF